jgi:hypothetical protein
MASAEASCFAKGVDPDKFVGMTTDQKETCCGLLSRSSVVRRDCVTSSATRKGASKRAGTASVGHLGAAEMRLS